MKKTTFQHDEYKTNPSDVCVKLATFSTSAAVLEQLLEPLGGPVLQMVGKRTQASIRRDHIHYQMHSLLHQLPSGYRCDYGATQSDVDGSRWEVVNVYDPPPLLPLDTQVLSLSLCCDLLHTNCESREEP